MGVPSTFSSRTKTDRPLASWPVTTVRTFIPCLFSSGLFMVTFLDTCDFVFIFYFFRVVEVSTLYNDIQAPTPEMAVPPRRSRSLPRRRTQNRPTRGKLPA